MPAGGTPAQTTPTPRLRLSRCGTGGTGTGRESYPQARRLLVIAGAGGSNGYRPRAWKDELAALATEMGSSITVCHFSPGTSKWNSIEHRSFAQIPMSRRGRPLASHEVTVNNIAASTTQTGLRVHAVLDFGRYPTEVAVSDQQMANLPIPAIAGMAIGTTPCARRLRKLPRLRLTRSPRVRIAMAVSSGPVRA